MATISFPEEKTSALEKFERKTTIVQFFGYVVGPLINMLAGIKKCQRPSYFINAHPGARLQTFVINKDDVQDMFGRHWL